MQKGRLYKKLYVVMSSSLQITSQEERRRTHDVDVSVTLSLCPASFPLFIANHITKNKKTGHILHTRPADTHLCHLSNKLGGNFQMLAFDWLENLSIYIFNIKASLMNGPKPKRSFLNFEAWPKPKSDNRYHYQVKKTNRFCILFEATSIQ